MSVQVEVTINSNVRNPASNDRLGIFAATEWHRLYQPYVPMDTGTLYNTVEIEPWQITHTVPYARYQYGGEIYSPSFPIMRSGTIVGWRSPPSKHASGRSLTYKKTQHPLACSEWDKVAAAARGNDLAAAIQAFIDAGGAF